MPKFVELPTDATVDGQAATPQFRLTDINKVGGFVRTMLGELIRDLMWKPSTIYGAMGGAYALTTGLGIDVYPPLAIYRQADGIIFSFLSDVQATLTLDAADPDHNRIDIIVAVLHESVPSNLNPRYFRQSPPNPGNPEAQINAADEVWDYVTIEVVKGTPGTAPVAPDVPLNSVLLYTITLPAAATALDNIFISDGRISVKDQQTQDEQIALLTKLVNDLLGFAPPYKASDVDIKGNGRFAGLTDQDAWDIIGSQSDANQYDPITRPQTQTADGKVGAVGTQESTIPVIDIPVGLSVAFSNGIQPITVNTIPASLNPRQVNKSSGSGTESDNKDTGPLTLSNLLTIESDGGGGWIAKSATTPSKKIAPAAAARDNRYIEVWGGYNAAGSQLSDWFTYDTVNDTVTTHTLTGDIPPAAGMPSMFTCGDNRHILLATTQGFTGATPHWFLVDTDDFSSVELTSGPKQTTDLSPNPYVRFIGDLVQADTIVFAAIANLPDSNGEPEIRTYWKYTISTQTFTQIFPTGATPTGRWLTSDFCFYQTGQLVLFEMIMQNALSGRTFIFDYGTLSFTQQNIAQPYNVLASNLSDGFKTTIQQFRMVNIGGKPTLFAGSDENSGGQTAFWQLTPGTTPSWQSFTPGGLPRLWRVGGASLLSNGFPKGGGFCFAGLDPAAQQATQGIFTFSQGGVIETVYAGVTGLTLAPGTRQATISLPAYQVALSGTVAKALISLDGFLPAGSIALSLSLDGGTTYQAVNREVVTSVLNSSSPGQRRLKITMYGGTNPPIITGIHETYSKTGSSDGLTLLYIRFDCPSSTKGLYINRDGTMEVSSSVVPTTPDKAILIQTVHNGNGNDPSVKNFINQRVMIVEYAGVKGGSNPQFSYDGAVAPRLITPEATTGGATGALYRIAEPTIAFNGTVTVTGLATASDYYHIRVFA